jgi:dihydroorotate dehydrogenase electron transfer subunit
LSKYFKAEITDNFNLNSNNNLLVIKPIGPVIDPEPGQFYMIETGDSYDPLLKRPFSYFRNTPETIQFVYTVKGKGTSLMKDFKKGRIINVLGPLGTAYPKPEDGCTPLLIAGGIGIASLFPLAEALGEKSYMLYGARGRDELVMLDELEKTGTQIITCTDDCSFGKEGLVTDILEDFLVSHPMSITPFLIYACGPRPMIASVSKIAAHKGIKGYVSLEERMACGFGACLGCAVKTVYGYKRVCKEGPVFPIGEIEWI